MKRFCLFGLATILVLAGALVGRATAEDKDTLGQDVQTAIELFKKTDPKIEKLFESAHGYAVFPDVTKGAAGIGAAHDWGQVFEGGKLIGTSELTQVTVGAQLGGQSYAEVIFFETAKPLAEFKRGELAMSAQASAVAAADGASANAKYQHGVLIFTIAKGGLMFEASVGGQKFSYTPLAMK